MNQANSITINREGGAPDGHNESMQERYEAGQASAAAGLSSVPSKSPANPDGAPTDPAPAPSPAGSPAATPATAPQVQPENPGTSFVDSLLTNAGLTRDGLSSELDTGSLSAATYAALAKQGVDQATVDQYVSGMVASSAAKTAEYETAVITSVVKDAAEYQRLVTWASSTLTKAEIDSYNKLVNGGDIDTAKFAVQALHTRFAAANRPEPKLLTSAVSQGSGVAGYQSWAQVTADMRKPEYRLDSAFRAEVEARLKVSGDLPR